MSDVCETENGRAPGNKQVCLYMAEEGYEALQGMVSVEGAGNFNNLARSIFAYYLNKRGIAVNIRPKGTNTRKIVAIRLDERMGDRILEVKIGSVAVAFRTADGREISRQIEQIPWLHRASDKQRAHKIIYGSQVFWPKIEEGRYLSLAQMLGADQTYFAE